MERDAFLLIGAFLFALITFNWSELKLVIAQFKAKKEDEEKTSEDNEPQDES